MARPDRHHAERQAELVRVATSVFARYGYAGTTNRRLAEAMVAATGRPFTPALLYHYFPEGKARLFAAVMRQYQPLQTFARALNEASDAPPEEFLRHAAHAYLRIYREPGAAQLVRILFSEGPRHPDLVRDLAGHVAPLILLPLATYFQRQAALGRLRPVDPLATIFQFFGPLLVRVLITDALGDIPAPLPLPDDETMIESHVATLLHGLATVAEAEGDGHASRSPSP